MTRNVIILSCSQALGMAGAPIVVLLGGIIGADLAPQASWATLPVALMVVGGAICTIPAALLMSYIGRRAGFLTATLLAAVAACGGAYAIAVRSFMLFCLATIFIGAQMAFVQQYRFAAAESVEPKQVSRAVSWVLVGGIAAAFLGPETAKIAQHWLPYGQYSGSFAALAIMYLLNCLFLLFLKTPPAAISAAGGPARPLSRVIRQPLYLTAVLAGLVAYGVMTFIMTATPVSMHVLDGHSLAETARVIQSHIVAMFAPSLFTGTLINRFGLHRVMITGTVFMIICVFFALLDHCFIHYWVALVLLGVGWNFLFVGATTLLTNSYKPAERFRAQAVNDFTVFGFQAVASLSAGTIIFASGWTVVNLISLPLLLFMILVLFNLRHRIVRSAS